jgi:hypothetical protein
MDGPHPALDVFAGLKLSDTAHNALVDNDWKEILLEVEADLIEVGEVDEMPGQSDVFYRILIDDAFDFARQLRETLVQVIHRTVQ